MLGLTSHSVDRVEEVVCDVLQVRIVPHRRSGPICSGCGMRGEGYDDLPSPRYRDLPFLGIEVEQVPWAMVKCPLTTPMVVVLSIFARLLSWEEVSRLFR